MNGHRHIAIECLGRLSNRLISWSNGRDLQQKVCPDRRLLINWPELKQTCTFPDTDNVDVNVKGWPKVKTDDIKDFNGDCVWVDSWTHPLPRDPWLDRLWDIKIDQSLWIKARNLIGNKKVIGVHIRYGDFREQGTKDWPFVRGTNEYFIERIEMCRKKVPGAYLFLASDGTSEELAWFNARYRPLRQPKNTGLLDMLTLARCRVIIPSKMSTFSVAAARLGRKTAHGEIYQ